MNLSDAIAVLEAKVSDLSSGLPDELFCYISKVTPLVNVDLLIKDETGATLLSWRDDEHCGTGWHIPGGIVRVKERLEDRVWQVAMSEIGTKVDFSPSPIEINQFIHHDRDIRCHFISMLYSCFLSSRYQINNEGRCQKDIGYLKWHDSCPKNLLEVHEIYRKNIEG